MAADFFSQGMRGFVKEVKSSLLIARGEGELLLGPGTRTGMDNSNTEVREKEGKGKNKEGNIWRKKKTFLQRRRKTEKGKGAGYLE